MTKIVKSKQKIIPDNCSKIKTKFVNKRAIIKPTEVLPARSRLVLITSTA